MPHLKPLIAAGVLALAPAAAQADLEIGETAPDFTVSGYQAGDAVAFTLSEALTEGPVVLFFFPAAYTSGCEAQAASFAESIDAFHAHGAQVIGVTAGNTDRLAEFSTQHCASAFPVFAVSEGMMGDYEVRLALRPGWTDRTTYVIGQDGQVAFTWSEMSPYEHVDRSLAALEDMSGD